MKYKTSIKNYKFKNFIDLSLHEKKLVLSWRNNIKVRKWMDNKKIISIKNHLEFVDNLKQNKHSLYLLISKNKRNIGVLTLNDINNSEAKIGYVISPTLKKREIVFEILFYCLFFCFNLLNLKKIYGFSLLANKKANTFNKMFNIKLIKRNKRYLGILYKKEWKTKVENNKLILNYLKFLK